jgi:hypothetical protein
MYVYVGELVVKELVDLLRVGDLLRQTSVLVARDLLGN